MRFLSLTLAFLLSVSASAVTIGKVNIQQVLLSVKQGKAIRDSLKKEFDKKQKVLKKEEASIRKLQESFKKQSMVMNEKARQKKEREIQGKIVQLQQKTMGYQKEMQEMENKKKMPILERVKTIIDDVSKKAGVDMTYEASTAPIVYAKDLKDLTQDVIKAYDKKYK